MADEGVVQHPLKVLVLTGLEEGSTPPSYSVRTNQTYDTVVRVRLTVLSQSALGKIYAAPSDSINTVSL